MRSVGLRQVFGLLAAALLLDLVLIMPNHPGALNLAALEMVPLELPVILLLLLLLPAASILGQSVRIALTAGLTIICMIKVADYFTRLAYARNFNLIVDWNLVTAGWHTLAESIGYVMTMATLLATLLAVGALAWLLWQATGAWLKLTPSPKLAKFALAGLIGASTVAAAEMGHVMGRWHLTYKPPGDTFTLRTAWRYVDESISTMASLKAFEQETASPTPDIGDGLLAKLKGHDVLLIYVESYGRSSFDNPLYAATHMATLRRAQDQLDNVGVAMRSGWLTAPMVGGQSWLAHSSVASGLWISDQGRYRALIASGRSTLFNDAQAAGFKTVAVMPAIRLAWPDGNYFGFDVIYPSQALGYRGLPFNWVTMPDQFVLAALDRLERNNLADRSTNLFAQVALSSSHAPFTPVPRLLPWDELGDGSIFNEMAQSGDSPETVWADSNRVREQFRLAIDYSLQTVFDYIARHAKTDPNRKQLVIVLGDHEPAQFISGVPTQDVAIHIMGPPELLKNIDAWNFTPGLIPSPSVQAWRMDEFRAKFVQTFSQGSPW